MAKNKSVIHYFANSIAAVTGTVLVWRGVWYALDNFDKTMFNGSHLWTASLGIIFGLIILYAPDKDLKEL